MWKYYLFGGISIGGLTFVLAISRGRSLGTSALVASAVGLLFALLLISLTETGKSMARSRQERLRAPLAELVKTLRMRGLSVERGGENASLIIADNETGKSFVLYIGNIKQA